MKLLSLLVGAAALLPALAGALPQDRPTEPTALAVEVPIYPNATCPIMGKAISTRLFVDTAKGRFWVCCKSCYEDILADLDTAHQTAYPEVVTLALEHCPVTGEPLPEEPHLAVVQGFRVPLCCPECADALLADSQIHLALLLDDELEDLRNPHCPITDEPVQPNAYATVSGVLVRLSSPRVLEELRAEPAKSLAAARASVADHGALPRPVCPRKEREAKRAEESGGDDARASR